MASNSKREQILVRVVKLIDEIPSIATVQRKPMLDLKSLSEEVAETQLPMMTVVGWLPRPDEKMSSRGKNLDLATSVLPIGLTMFALSPSTPDTTVSTIADDLWAKMLSDVSLGFKWVIETKIMFPEDLSVLIIHPYAMFHARMLVTYHHSKGGI